MTTGVENDNFVDHSNKNNNNRKY